MSYRQKGLENNMDIKIIEKLPVERWQEYKDLRTRALTGDPLAFSTEFFEVENEPDDYWQKRLEKNLNGESIIIFAEIDGKLVGTGSVYLFTKERFKHNADLQALYVDPAYRGKGIGQMLIEKRIEMVTKIPEIKNILCEIYSTQQASIEVHKKLGFEITGVIKDFVLIDGKYYDDIQMVKRIR